MTDKRLQLNVRLDGRDDLLEAVKLAAESDGLSLNGWLIKALESAVGIESSAPVSEELESAITSVLDKVLANKIADIRSALRDELLGESAA
jgi:hypothetical protein